METASIARAQGRRAFAGQEFTSRSSSGAVTFGLRRTGVAVAPKVGFSQPELTWP